MILDMSNSAFSVQQSAFRPGQRFQQTRTLTLADFATFARLSGDDNPIHVDPDFAAQTRFGRPVAHGMMLYGLICGLLNQVLPDAVQLSQQMMFPAPTFADQPITIQAELAEYLADGEWRILTQIFQGEYVTCRGECIVRLLEAIQ